MNTNNQQLRDIIESNKMTHDAVAILLEVSKSAVDKWATDNRMMPTASIRYLTILIKAQGEK